MPYREEVLHVAQSRANTSPQRARWGTPRLPGPQKAAWGADLSFSRPSENLLEAEAARASGRASRSSPSLVLAPGQPGSAAPPAAQPADFQPSKGKLYSMRHSAPAWSWGFFPSSLCSFEYPTDRNTQMMNFKVGRQKKEETQTFEKFLSRSSQVRNNIQKRSDVKASDPVT